MEGGASGAAGGGGGVSGGAGPFGVASTGAEGSAGELEVPEGGGEDGPAGSTGGGSARSDRLILEGATPSLVTSSCTGELCWVPRFTTRKGPRGAKERPSAA